MTQVKYASSWFAVHATASQAEHHGSIVRRSSDILREVIGKSLRGYWIGRPHPDVRARSDQPHTLPTRKSGQPLGTSSSRVRPRTWQMAMMLRRLGLAGAPGMDSPFSNFWKV